MANGNGGDGVLKVVELFIDNINEYTKIVTHDIERVENKVESIKSKINTPPRNEELSKGINDIDEKLEIAISTMGELKTAIRLMTNAVRVAVVVLGLAAMISGAVVYFGNRSLVNQLNNPQNTELKLLKDAVIELKSEVEGKGAVDGKVSGKDG